MFVSFILGLVGCSLASSPGLSAEEVATAFDGLCDHNNSLGGNFIPESPLVRLDRDLPAPKLAVSMVVSKDAWQVDGEGLTPNVAMLSDILDGKAEAARDLATRTNHPDYAFNGELVLFVGPDVPASSLEQVFLAAHRSAFNRLSMVVRLRPNPNPDFFDPVYAAELIAEQEALMPSDRRVDLSRMDARRSEQEAMMGRCPKMAKALQAVGAASAELKCEIMARALAEALPSCRRADGAKILTGMQVLAMPGPWRLGSVELHIDPDGAQHVVEPSATWAELAAGWADLPQTPTWFTIIPDARVEDVARPSGG